VAGADITVVIPAYNERKHIKETVISLSQESMIREIIVVDDGSADDTYILAEEAGARVIRLEQNVGKGRAIMAAFPFISSETVLLLDADLRASARFALVLAKPILENKADLTVARFSRGLGGQGFGLVKGFSRLGIKLLTGKYFDAPLSGQRCIKKKVLRELFPLADRFGLEVGMNIDAIRQGYKLIEVDTALSHCPPGRDWSGFMHRGEQLLNICRVLVSRILRQQVMKP